MDIIGWLNDVTGNNLLGWKVALTSGVIALAGLQLALAARLWGVGGLRMSPATAATAHRWNGRAVIIGGLLVAFSCLVGPAGATTPTRAVVHSVLGSVLFLVLIAKFALLKLVRSGGRYLPVTGSALFLSFLAIWATSVADYVTR